MSARVLSWAWQLQLSNPLSKLIAFYLADYCDFEGVAEVDRQSMREWCCADEEDFREALLDLEADSGVIYEFAAVRSRLRAQLPLPKPEPSPPPGSSPLPPRRAWLYVITAGGKTKVGISRKLEGRLAWLQSGNPEKITLRTSFQGMLPSIRILEKSVHTRLSAARVAGEWFNIPPEEAIEAVRAVIAALSLEVVEESDQQK